MSRWKAVAEATEREKALARLAKLERMFAYKLYSAEAYWPADWKPPSGPRSQAVVHRTDYWRQVAAGGRNLARKRADLGLEPKPMPEIPPDLTYLTDEDAA